MTKTITLMAIVMGLTAGPVLAGTQGVRVAQAEMKAENAPQPTGEHMSDSQKKNLETLKKDLEAISQGSEVTDAQKEALATSLKGIADTANPPSEESVNALASSLSTAKADGQIDPKEAMQLAQDVTKVLDSANISAEDAQMAIKDAQAVLEAAGVDKETATQVASDLQNIFAEIQKNSEANKAKAAEAAAKAAETANEKSNEKSSKRSKRK